MLRKKGGGGGEGERGGDEEENEEGRRCDLGIVFLLFTFNFELKNFN